MTIPSSPTVRVLALVATTALFALFAASAHAGPPGKWSQVTGPQENTTELGLARSGDGVLHVIWAQDTGLGGIVHHSALSANAKTWSGPNTVYSYPDGLNNRLALVSTAGGLRAFFAGLVGTESNPLQGRLATATSTDGTSWTVQPDSASNNTDTLSSVYASAGVAAAVGTDGTPITAWGDTGSGYHFGISSTTPDMRYGGGSCCVYAPGIGVDSVTGETVLAWQFLQTGNGTAYQTIRPAVGPMIQPTGARAANTSTRTAITGRIGAAGVYLAYLRGTNQFMSSPAVVRTSGGSAYTFRGAKDAEDIGIAAAPGGRLWVFWQRKGKITAVRSNTKATKWGAPVTIKPPKNTSVIYNLAGEGSLGPLDLFALVDRSSILMNWQQRILPGLTLSAASAHGKIKFRVTDAGSPVRGAKVKAGGRSKRTNSAGRATINLRAGRYRATATKTGYAPAKVTARAR